MTVLLAGPPDCDPDPGFGWVRPEDLRNCSIPDNVDLALACNATAELLGMLSFDQYGLTTETVRPVGMTTGCRCYGSIFDGAISYGGALSVTWGSWWDWPAWSCGCGSRGFIELQPPVASDGVLAVSVDGIALDESQWAVKDGRWLVRTDGISFACCQSVALPSSEPGTLAITYQHGPNVPPAARGAARVFACEYAKALAGQDCMLTGQIQSVTRDGVSAALLFDPQAFRDGLTGIPAVDMWLRGVRRNSPPRAGTIGRPMREPAGLVREP